MLIYCIKKNKTLHKYNRIFADIHIENIYLFSFFCYTWDGGNKYGYIL